MKKNKTFLLSQKAIEALERKAEQSGRKLSQLVERAIMRCYGNEVKA